MEEKKKVFNGELGGLCWVHVVSPLSLPLLQSNLPKGSVLRFFSFLLHYDLTRTNDHSITRLIL